MGKKRKHTKERRYRKVATQPGPRRTFSGQQMETLREVWGKGKEARALEEALRLLEIHPRDAQLHIVAGQLYAQKGEQPKAFEHLERAARLAPSNPEVHLARAAAYVALGIHSNALRAARRYLALAPDGEMAEQMRQYVQLGEQLMAKSAAQLGVSVKRMEQGSALMEEGHLAVSTADLAYGLRCSKEAASLLPKWPVPRNNVALAQFYLGRAEEAIATEEKVLAELDPANIHALANLVLFHTALGQTKQAEAYGARLEKLTPALDDDRLKMAQAFVWLKRDQAVYDVLSGKGSGSQPVAEAERNWLLGVAAANLGKMDQARRHLARADVESDTFRSKVASLIRAGLPGPRERYPYYPATHQLPPETIKQAMKQLGGRDKAGSQQTLRELAKRYPALIDVAAETLWLLDDDAAKSAVDALRSLGDETARETLRLFATGRVGSDDVRMHAALALASLEDSSPSQPMTIIKDGQPTQVELRRINVVTSKAPTYKPEIERMLEQAIIDQRAGRGDRAEELYNKILAKDSRVKEAWGNLAVLYFSRGDKQRGEQYVAKALEVDPLYIMARANLASIRLSEGRLEEAKELLQPLAQVREFHAQEMVWYLTAMARLAIAEERFEEAESHLKLLLEINPQNQWAQQTLAGLQVASLGEDMRDWFHENQRRYKERKRKEPISPEDSLESLLSRYPKDTLSGVARELSLASASSLKKNDLVATLCNRLLDADALQRALGTLTDQEKVALRFVLQAGGVVPLAQFAERYGDDGDESPYWNWHTPKSVLGRLKVRGLLFEGTHGGQVVVLVPQQLRAVCSEFVATPKL